MQAGAVVIARPVSPLRVVAVPLLYLRVEYVMLDASRDAVALDSANHRAGQGGIEEIMIESKTGEFFDEEKPEPEAQTGTAGNSSGI